jgi:hypothetical protein
MRRTAKRLMGKLMKRNGFVRCRASIRHKQSFCPVIFLPILTMFVLPGCGGEEGPRRLSLEGSVTNAGDPLRVEGRDVGIGMVVVEFYPVAEDGSASTDPLESASVSESGEFVLVDGIPPGRYKIAVRQWDPYPQVDRLDGRFSPVNTQIVRELTSDDQVLEIDVSKPEG